MITTVEKELIIAYFQGGNARGEQNERQLEITLETIKEAAKESKARETTE